MIPLADALRWFDAPLALFLVLACSACAVYAASWDQRVRFTALAGYGAVTIGGQLALLGQPFNWRVPVLAATTVAAVVSTAAYLLKARRALATEEGLRGDDARPAAREHRVPRAGAAAGGGRHARRDEGPQSGGGPT